MSGINNSYKVKATKAAVPSFICCGPNVMAGCQRPKKRMNPLNPNEEDPRPPPPCVRNQCCCACRPQDPQRPGPCFNMKLIQLQNCYGLTVSDATRRRRSRFYDRWQQWMDRMDRMPDYDYKVYCCDDYVDLSINRDFDRYFYYKPNLKGQREQAKYNFMFPRALSESVRNEECIRNECAPNEYCPEICTPANTFEDRRTQLEKQIRLYQEEGYSHWHQHMLRSKPDGFVNTATPVKSRISPFHKDTSFSTPLLEFSTGNEPPFKEIRAVKVNM